MSSINIKSNYCRLVFFYSRIPPYLITVINSLMKSGKIRSIDVVHWDHGNDNGNKYKPTPIDGLNYTGRSSIDDNGLYDLLESKHPHAVYVSGWMDKGYLNAIKRYRSRNSTIVISGIDDQWQGNIRQILGSIYYQIAYRGLIDVMWVSGGPQRVYASHFGYKGMRVIPYLLSADVDSLSNVEFNDKKRFLFLGRFDPVKGLDLLIDAYKNLPSSIKEVWSLELIGDGVLRDNLLSASEHENIKIHPYVQPKDLGGILSGGGVACFPSRHEQWGVAIHELAAAGYPLILSDACGAGSEFLINGYNGFSCRTGSAVSLSSKMLRIAEMSPTERCQFSTNSRILSKHITPDLSASALLSLIDE